MDPVYGNEDIATAVAEPRQICAECGGTFPQEDMIPYQDVWVCAQCKPAFFQKLKEGVRVGKALDFASFGSRFLARILDTIISMIAVLVLMVVTDPLLGMVLGPMGLAGTGLLRNLFVAGFYSIYFVGKYGATPGKMALKIMIVKGDGSRMDFRLATARFFADWVSSMTMLIGYIMAAFDEEHRTLHDRMCNTRVIKVSSE